VLVLLNVGVVQHQDEIVDDPVGVACRVGAFECRRVQHQDEIVDDRVGVGCRVLVLLNVGVVQHEDEIKKLS